MPVPIVNGGCASCFTSYTANPVSITAPCGDDCIHLGTIVVACTDSVGPCSAQGTVPFDCFCIPCDNPTFQILNTSSLQYLTVDSISKTGLVFTTNGVGTGNSKEEINIKVICKDADGCNIQSDYGTIVIYLKDLCAGVVCPTGEECDKCTGICGVSCVDVAVGPGNSLSSCSSSVDLKIS